MNNTNFFAELGKFPSELGTAVRADNAGPTKHGKPGF